MPLSTQQPVLPPLPLLPERAAGRTAGQMIVRLLKNSAMEIILLAMCVGLAIRLDNFVSFENLLNILRTISMPGIIALGMTMVIIAGEIDLSVGSTVAFSGAVAAWLTGVLTGSLAAPQWLSAVVTSPHMNPTLALCVGIFGALLAGSAAGCVTGFVRMRSRVPTFITTLAWFTILRGAAGLLIGTTDLRTFPTWFRFVGSGYVWGIPFQAFMFIGMFVVVQFVMSYTSFGRAVYAVGGNAEAARLSGIRVRLIKIAVMGIVGGLASLSGLIQSSQIMAARADSGQGWELEVISAVIIGGASLSGGAGSIWGTLIGVFFLGVLFNGLTMLGYTEYWQYVIRGGLILVAVLINTISRER